MIKILGILPPRNTEECSFEFQIGDNSPTTIKTKEYTFEILVPKNVSCKLILAQQVLEFMAPDKMPELSPEKINLQVLEEME